MYRGRFPRDFLVSLLIMVVNKVRYIVMVTRMLYDGIVLISSFYAINMNTSI